MKKILALLLVVGFASLHAQTNPLAENKRFIRGDGGSPNFQNFVIPLDGQKGVELDLSGLSSTTLNPTNDPGWIPPWFVRIQKERRIFIASTISVEFDNAMVAFGSRGGGTSLFTGQEYSFGTFFGGRFDNDVNAFEIRIYAYERAGLDQNFTNVEHVDYQTIRLPRRGTPEWDAFAANGYKIKISDSKWENNQTPGHYGLETELQLVESPGPDGMWGVVPGYSYPWNFFSPIILTHKATSSGYYFKVESLGIFLTSFGWLPMVVNPQGNGTFNTLYTLDFDERPAWRSTILDVPHFNGEPMPPEYVGKSQEELNQLGSPVTKQFGLPTPGMSLTDTSPELRDHPELQKLIDDLGADPLALANYVINEIELTDALSYNESGAVSEESINAGGINRGALATYLEGQGSPAEQCALLVYLLRKTGVPAAFVRAPQNELLMLDKRMSQILKIQIQGAVDAEGNSNVPEEISVNYPWVAAYVPDSENPGENKWVHIFPWIKDTEIKEGLDLYKHLPEGFDSGYLWLKKYLFKDPAIMSLGDESDIPATLFPRFVKKALQDHYPGLSLENLGVQIRNRRNLYARWEDFPQPWSVTEEYGEITLLENFASSPLSFDMIAIEVWNDQNGNKVKEASEPSITTGNLRTLDLHNRRLLIRHEKTGVDAHNLILSLAAFRPSATGTADFSDPALLDRQVKVMSLGATDDSLGVKITYTRHRSLPGGFSAPLQSESFLGITNILTVEEKLALRKGETSAFCMTPGRVTERMLLVSASEFWNAQQALKANPASGGDPEIFQGGAAQLMGMSYFMEQSRFGEFAEKLHKVNQISKVMMGLSTLSPQRDPDGSLPNDGDIHLVYPSLDMFFQSLAFAGNGTLHADNQLPYLMAVESFFHLLTANGSAQEHRTINQFFGKTDSVSTVKLLHLAQEANRPIVKIDNFNYEDTGVDGNPGVPYTVDVNGTPVTNSLYGWDPGLVKSALTGLGRISPSTIHSNYEQIFFTPGPVLGASGDFFGMGAFIVSREGSTTLISGIFNGGFGSALFLGAFDPANFLNINLRYDSYLTLTMEGPIPTDPRRGPELWQPWDFDRYEAYIQDGSYYPSPFQDYAWSQGAESLGFTGGRAAELALVKNSGWTGVSEWFGTAMSTVSALIGDPVHSVTGAFYLDAIDLTLPGPMPLQIRRTYSSQNLAENEFGYGWKLAYFPFLSVAASEDIIYAAEMDGSVIAYRKQSPTLWVPEPQDNPTLCNMTDDVLGSVGNMFNAKIEKIPQGSDIIYLLSGPDGSTRKFKVRSFLSGGLTRTRPYLERWTDHRGNSIDFTFGENAARGDFGQLTRIASSNGSFVGFNYNNYGRITEAFNGDGRRVVYGYDKYGDLVSVTRPDASVVGYDYQHVTDGETYSNHLIIRERKPEGRILENDYDEFRRVVEQRATVGEDMTPVRNATFEYNNTLNTDPQSPYFNTLSGHTLIWDAYDGPTRYDYVGGQITKITDALNQTISQVWYAPGDTSPGAFPRSLASKVDKRQLSKNFYYDSDGNLDYMVTTGDLTGDGTADTATTDYEFNSLHLPTVIVEPMNNRTEIYYDDTARPRLPTRIESHTPTALVSRTLHSYTDVIADGKQAKGLLERTTIAEGSPDAAVTEWSYDSRGFPRSMTRLTGTSDPNVTTTYVFNARGEEIERKDAAGRKVISAYDAMGRRTWEEFWETTGRIGWNYRYFNGNGEVEWTDGPRYAPEDYVWRKYDGAGRPREELIWRSSADGTGTGVIAGLPDVDLYSNSIFVHNLFGDLTDIYNPLQNRTSMTYDEIGQMLTRTFYDGPDTSLVMATESWTREPGGLPGTYTNPLGGDTNYFYTSDGKIRRQENPDDTILEWRYRLDGRVEREPVNHNTYFQIVYNDDTRTVTKTLKTLAGATLATESKTLDRRGNVVSETDLSGATWTRTFDGLNRPKTVTGPPATANAARQQTTYIYDNSGQTLTVKNAQDEETTTVTDIMGRTTSIEVRSSANELVRHTSFGYSSDHHSITTTHGTGEDAISSTTFTDTLGREVLHIDGEEKKTISIRDAQGLLREVIDPLQRVTKFTYDALDRPFQTFRPDGSWELTGFDPAGNMFERNMNDALLWYGEYDSAGRQVLETTYLGNTFTRIIQHTYLSSGPNAGLRDTTIDHRNTTFTHGYDNWRRLESLTATGSTPEQNQSISWTYDNRGIPETITQTGGGQPGSTITPYGQTGSESVSFDGGTTSSITQTWDSAGRRESLSANQGGGAAFQPEFGYNAAGQMTSVTVGGNLYSSTYTTAGLLNTRSNPFRTQSITDRDAVGRILTQTVTAGSLTPLSETQTWRDDGRLDSYTAQRLGDNAWNESRSYGYDLRGQLLSEGYARGPDATATLNYQFSANKLCIRTSAYVGALGNDRWFINATEVNTLARLRTLSDNTATRSIPASGASFGAASVKLEINGVPGPLANHPGWQDATGEWTAQLELVPGRHTLTARGVHPSGWLSDPATSTFTLFGTPQTLTQEFDNMGNLTSKSWSGGKVQTLTWDAFGRLIKVQQTGLEPFVWTAAYDALGRRLRTTWTPSGESTFVVTSSFDPQVEFMEVGVNINGSQNWRINGPDLNGAFGGLNGTGGLEAVIMQNGTTGTIQDAFGNVVASVEANNTVTWSPTKVGGYGFLPEYFPESLESGASLIEASTWRTRRHDPTGLINLGARHFDPKTGVFTSADPLGHAASWSLYDFANGDPVNQFDPDGRFGNGVSQGFAQTTSMDSPDSWAYSLGQMLGATTLGVGAGLGEGAVNIGIGVKDTAIGTAEAAWAFSGGAAYNLWQGEQTIYGDLYESAYSLATSSDARSVAWQSVSNYAHETFTDTDKFSQRIGGGSAVTLMTLGVGKFAEGLRSANTFAPALKTIPNPAARGTPQLALPGLSGAADDIVVLGRQVDTAVAKNWPGHKVLDIQNWTIPRNDAFMQSVIQNKQKVYLGSPQTRATLWDAKNNRPTVFSRELDQLKGAGYRQQGDYMLPPSN